MASARCRSGGDTAVLDVRRRARFCSHRARRPWHSMGVWLYTSSSDTTSTSDRYVSRLKPSAIQPGQGFDYVISEAGYFYNSQFSYFGGPCESPPLYSNHLNTAQVDFDPGVFAATGAINETARDIISNCEGDRRERFLLQDRRCRAG